MATVVLVLNCGSSSVKFALIDPDLGAHHLTGLAERVGTPEASLTIRDHTGDGAQQVDTTGSAVGGAARSTVVEVADPSHRGVVTDVLTHVLDWVSQRPVELIAVGHRVAHGGEQFDGPAVLSGPALDQVRALSRLAPLHNPANVAGVVAAAEMMPDLPQVGVFDTAFHHGMPAEAYRDAVPNSWYTELGVRRYGFHGTSHDYVSAQAAALVGRPREQLRMVTAHLGNGCSLAAVHRGRSVDTTMGLTPLSGLVMGTRCGDLDPGVHGYLAERTGMTLAQITEALNRDSGLLGLSGISNDMREVQVAAQAGDPNARLALDVFGYRLAKHIAALMVPLAGLDVLVFTGGIGENSPSTRAEAIDRLGFLGWRLDPGANAATVGGKAGVITRPGPPQAPIAVVIGTDEELVIARQSAELVLSGKGTAS